MYTAVKNAKKCPTHVRGNERLLARVSNSPAKLISHLSLSSVICVYGVCVEFIPVKSGQFWPKWPCASPAGSSIRRHIALVQIDISSAVLWGDCLKCALRGSDLKVGIGEDVVRPGGRSYPCPPRIRVLLGRPFSTERGAHTVSIKFSTHTAFRATSAKKNRSMAH